MSSPFKAGRYQDTSAAANEQFNVPNRFSEFETSGRNRTTARQRQQKQQNWPLVLLTLILVVAFAGLPVVTAHGATKGSKHHHTHTAQSSTKKHSATRSSNTTQAATISNIVQTTLNNIANNGYDPLKNGLWVNWSTGTAPLQADFVNGKPDCLVKGGNINCKFSPAHDPLTDLRALRNFWTYKTDHPGDHSYDAQIALYTPIVQTEFNNFANLSTNGWLFDEWIGLAKLSGDNTYYQIAQSEVNFWYTHYYHSSIGAIYFTNHNSSTGEYRVDYTMEMATAMAEAGAIFHQSNWLDAGRQAIEFIYLHAYNVNDHLFALDMNNVVTSNGQANQCETFYNPPGALGNDASPSSNLRIALSLLRAYLMTNTGAYLAHALDLLDAFSLPNNTAGLWDTHYAGYFTRAQFTGTGYCSFGSLHITSVEKEGGRMLISLEAYHVANWLLGNRYASTESALLSVALNDAYLPAGQGYMFVQAQDWSLLRIEDCGQTNSCVTTEAMGIALEALQSIQASNPW